jgi:hypothetical protein
VIWLASSLAPPDETASNLEIQVGGALPSRRYEGRVLKTLQKELVD